MKTIFKCIFALLLCISLWACSSDTAKEPEKPVETIKISNVLNMNLTEAKEQLYKDGFKTISVKDYDPNWDPGRYFVTEQNYEAGTEVKANEEIVLTCIKKCYLYMEITSESNLLFSTYDIDVYLADNLVGTVANGNTITNLYTVNEGQYKLTAYKSGDVEVSGEYTMDLHEDITFTAELSHSSVSIRFTDSKKSSGVSPAVIEEFKKAWEDAKYTHDYTTSQEFQKCSVGSYSINVPENWKKENDDMYFSPDGNAMVAVSEYDEKGWTDELADAAFEKLLENKKDDLIENDSQQINQIKMRRIVYHYTLGETPVILTGYVFVDKETTELCEIRFYEAEASKQDHSKDFDKMIHSLHKTEDEKGEPAETVQPTPEPTLTPTPEPEKKNSLFYTTNDKETAKQGNTGVYAYTKSASYAQYYIIDFDEGYVYYFTDGNGDETCERLKIDSGDLNSRMQVTYHDGGDTWSNYFYFKWKNQPDNLIMEDSGEYQVQFRATDLDDALEIRDTKKIKDY